MRFHDPNICELRPDKWQKRKGAKPWKACYGKVIAVGVVKLCYRHRMIVKAILEDSKGVRQRASA